MFQKQFSIKFQLFNERSYFLIVYILLIISRTLHFLKRLFIISIQRPEVFKNLRTPRILYVKLSILYWETYGVQRAKLAILTSKKMKTVYNFKAFSLPEVFNKEISLASVFCASAFDVGISIVVPIYNPKKIFLNQLCQSIVRQTDTFQNFEVIFVDDNSSTSVEPIIDFSVSKQFPYKIIRNKKNLGISGSQNVGISFSSKELIAFLDHDDILPADSLAWFALYAKNNPQGKIFYSDEATINWSGKIISTWFKSSFNRIENQFHNSLHHFFAFRSSVAKEIGCFNSNFDGAQDFEFTLRCMKHFSDDEFIHIPHICYHWRSHSQSTASGGNQKPEVVSSLNNAVRPSLEKIKSLSHVPEAAKFNGWSLVQPIASIELGQCRKCSVIIPSRNNICELHSCIKSIIETPDPSVDEIIIVDDQSDCEKTFIFYNSIVLGEELAGQLNSRNIELKIVCDIESRKSFNFSRLVNLGAHFSVNPIIILVNNDLTIETENWSANLSMFIGTDDTGIVGALLTQDTMIEHSGVVVGANNGLAANIDAGRKLATRQFSIRLNSVREVTAVTGAFMAIDLALFEKLNGFDENNLAVEFNDVDFCLRARELGYRVVINPHVRASHKTSTSRKDSPPNLSEHIFYLKKHFQINDLFTSPRLYYEGVGAPKTKALVSETFFASYIHVKILLHELSFTGAPIFAYELCVMLKSYGFKFSIYSLVDGPLREKFEQMGFEVRSAKKPITPYISKLQEFEKFCSEFGFFDDGSSCLTEVLLVNTAICLPLAAVISKNSIRKRNFSVHVHESYDFTIHAHLFLDRDLVDLTMEFCKFEIFLSIFQSPITMEYYKSLFVNSAKLLLPGSVNVSDSGSRSKNKFKRELGLKSSNYIISVIGTISERKNQMAIVDALLKSAQKVPNHIKFVLYGGNDSDYCIRLRKKIVQNRLENVIVRSTDSEPDRVFGATDLLLSLSKNESYPRVILEALGRQIPIIAIRYYGIEQLLKHQVNAVILEDDNPTNLIAELLLWVDRPEELGALANLGCRDNLRLNNPSMLSIYHAHSLIQATLLSKC